MFSGTIKIKQKVLSNNGVELVGTYKVYPQFGASSSDLPMYCVNDVLVSGYVTYLISQVDLQNHYKMGRIEILETEK
jgi:hypothetical protein